ncbi:MAG: DUF721 domain-containing protein [Proteobacteria bacterium]|nr:DUF721 domain-containing protein [Pseudomonadota bacterium]
MTLRRQGLRAIARELPDVTKSALARRGFAAARVIADWPEIVGPELAEASVPERVVRGHGAESATLVVRVRPAAALELQHWEPQLIERLNGYFGFRAVGRIRLVQGPVAARTRRARPSPPAPSPADAAELERRLAPLAASPLHGALLDLGKAIRGRARKTP